MVQLKGTLLLVIIATIGLLYVPSPVSCAGGYGRGGYGGGYGHGGYGGGYGHGGGYHKGGHSKMTILPKPYPVPIHQPGPRMIARQDDDDDDFLGLGSLSMLIIPFLLLSWLLPFLFGTPATPAPRRGGMTIIMMNGDTATTAAGDTTTATTTTATTTTATTATTTTAQIG